MQRNQDISTVTRNLIKGLAVAAGIAGLAAFGSAAQAAPAAAVNIIGGFDVLQLTDNAPITVHGCHRRARLGWVRRWGDRAWHRHRGSRCRPRQARPRYSDDYYAPRRRYQAPRHYRRNCAWIGPVRVCD